jgi:hypothetical protein
MAVLRPAHPPSASRGCPYAVPLAMAASGTPAARPHACAPVSRCTTVPSRSPPQRLQRCKSFSAALIAFDSAPRQSPPSSPSRPARVAPAAPVACHPTPARRASRRRPAACADCARLARLGEPPVAPAGVPREKCLYISYTPQRGPIGDVRAEVGVGMTTKRSFPRKRESRSRTCNGKPL